MEIKKIDDQKDTAITLGQLHSDEYSYIDALETAVSLNDRVVWLTGEVNDSCLTAAKTILRANREDSGKPVEDREPIKLMIYSPGGSIEIMRSLVDVIGLSATPIIGINLGLAASAACVIYLACHKKYALPSSTFMIHSGDGEFSGTYTEVIPAVTAYTQHVQDMVNYILSKTTLKADDLSERLHGDWYISATDAVKYHIADKIVDTIDDIL